MTVHFIGAGPGAPDLLTLRGRDLIAGSPVCLYAGSLIPVAVLDHCAPDARIVNTAPLELDQIMAEIAAAHAAGHDVARLHSGDLSVWSAMGEQLRRLRALDIPFTVTPGVPAFAAAAAALEAELTLPALSQSLVLTRTPGRASTMPPAESLTNFAVTGATLAIHLSVHNLAQVVADLTPAYGAYCPVAVVWRASWPDQRIVRATLDTVEQAVAGSIERTALILVGRVLAAENFAESSLYAHGYDRRFRPRMPLRASRRHPNERAGLDHCRPGIGDRQDHGDAGPASRAERGRTDGAAVQERTGLYRPSVSPGGLRQVVVQP